MLRILGGCRCGGLAPNSPISCLVIHAKRADDFVQSAAELENAGPVLFSVAFKIRQAAALHGVSVNADVRHFRNVLDEEPFRLCVKNDSAGVAQQLTRVDHTFVFGVRSVPVGCAETLTGWPGNDSVKLAGHRVEIENASAVYQIRSCTHAMAGFLKRSVK